MSMSENLAKRWEKYRERLPAALFREQRCLWFLTRTRSVNQAVTAMSLATGGKFMHGAQS